MGKLKSTFQEVIAAVGPMVAIIFALMCVVFLPDSALRGEFADYAIKFFFGAVLAVAGMTVFLFGAEYSMLTVGELAGSSLLVNKRIKSSTGRLVTALLAAFIIGTAITLAEPDVRVLATQVSNISGGAISSFVLILFVGIGVGLFIVLALAVIIFRKNLILALLLGYVLVFIMAIFFTRPEFVPVSFDSGGVTTGPITVPFIMAFAAGATMVIGNKRAGASFGMVGVASIGPIIACLLLGSFVKPMAANISEEAAEAAGGLMAGFIETAFEVFVAVAPMVVIFLILQFLVLRLKMRKVRGVLVGFLITYIGLTLFMHGVTVAFIPVGTKLGDVLADMKHPAWIIPLAFALGFVVAFAEPAVRVLNRQVYEESAGAINQRVLLMCISIGVAIAVALAIVRILAGFSLWWIIAPGYALAFILAFAGDGINLFRRKILKKPRSDDLVLVDPTFAALAFDSGGVATGPMCSTFVMSFCLAVSEKLGANHNPMLDGLGMVALVALAPIISIMTMSTIERINHYAHVRRAMSEINYRR